MAKMSLIFLRKKVAEKKSWMCRQIFLQQQRIFALQKNRLCLALLYKPCPKNIAIISILLFMLYLNGGFYTYKQALKNKYRGIY